MSGPVMVGVEEEFLLVDAGTGRPAPRIDDVIRDAESLAGDAAQTELHRAQIETASPPCETLDELRESLAGLRTRMAAAAARHGARVVASGTYPGEMGGEGQLITGKDRYETMAERAGLLADEHLICGCHVHVTVGDTDQAVRVVNRLRRFLPVLLALSANSPFWQGRDSGFASFRTEVWSRWPTWGPPGWFRDSDEYRRVVDSLVAAGVILDRGMAYWDARPSDRFPTVEVRVADVALTADDAVALAGLARALVVHVTEEDDAAEQLRPEWQRAASWLAARHGLDGDLLDPLDGTALPARRAVEMMLDRLGPTLDRLGDASPVTELVGAILAGGTGASRQRRAYEHGGLAAVLDLAQVAS
ncbi:MAG TPA: glutamate--cysteine ligase [Acidimicrobiales bacterium]|nr:glutamate--cysteine ligase [Acidimicrobiales bacterium]